MQAKAYFGIVASAERELKLIMAQLRHYDDIGQSMGGFGGALGGKHNNYSRVEHAAVAIADLTADLEEKAQDYRLIIRNAEQVISQVPQETYRRILTLRYLCGLSFRSISDEIGYSKPQSVYRAHGWALMEAQRVLNKMEKAQEGIIFITGKQ